MSEYTNTILVTGGTTGLGYEIALQIARQQPSTLIIIASRSNGDDAAGRINKTTGQNNVRFLTLDLLSLTKVKDFAQRFLKANYPPISALVLNSALQFPGPVDFNDDGVEKTFAISHLGHAQLFYLLRANLLPTARIVLTASGVHDPALDTHMPHPNFTTAEEVAHPDPATANKDGRERYTTTKLSNILWGYALDRHAKESGKSWTVVSVDPGLMPGTGLARQYAAPIRWLWNHILPRMLWLLRLLMDPNIHSAQESGAAITKLAIGSGVTSGKYYEGAKERNSSVDSYDKAKQDDLWTWTAKKLASNESERRSFETLN